MSLKNVFIDIKKCIYSYYCFLSNVGWLQCSTRSGAVTGYVSSCNITFSVGGCEPLLSGQWFGRSAGTGLRFFFQIDGARNTSPVGHHLLTLLRFLSKVSRQWNFHEQNVVLFVWFVGYLILNVLEIIRFDNVDQILNRCEFGVGVAALTGLYQSRVGVGAVRGHFLV